MEMRSDSGFMQYLVGIKSAHKADLLKQHRLLPFEKPTICKVKQMNSPGGRGG